MKIVLENNECILVRECEDENVRDTNLGIISAKLVKIQQIKGKSKAHCECVELASSQDVLFEDLLSHLGDISSSIKIDLGSLGDKINKFCRNTEFAYSILVRVASNGKSLRFDIYDNFEKEFLYIGLRLDHLVEYIDEINKKYEAIV